MRKVRFRDPAGSVRTGNWTESGIEAAGRSFASSDVSILPPVQPTKVIGVANNYQDESSTGSPEGRPIGWMKGGPNILAGHGSTVTLPSFDDVIFEGEMGIVIGEQCRNVNPSDAFDVIGGYTCVNDLTVVSSRDVGPFYERKSFDNALPIGPVVVPPEAIDDEPHIQVWVNDEKQQDSAGETFIYSIPEVISELSSNVTLEPDDVILMGTPSGAVPLEDGDRVRVQIDAIGTLEHTVETP